MAVENLDLLCKTLKSGIDTNEKNTGNENRGETVIRIYLKMDKTAY